MTMLLYALSLVAGLALLVWSADKFVDGASSVARHYKMSPLLIGMVIIGFGTSAPELVVSAISAYQGNAGIALGNAYGSNITNIAMILGLTALLMPISVNSQVVRKELPILTLVSLFSVGLIYDFELSRLDAILLLVVFALLMAWTVIQGMKNKKDAFAKEMEEELKSVQVIPLQKSYVYLIFGLVLLIVSSRMLVYGAVGIATALGVSDIVIGLTVVAVGTSLPELASSVIAAKKGEPDIALGHVLGSNLFNTLAVVGLAGVIHPLSFEKEILYRDVLVMLVLTVSLFAFGYSRKGVPKISRWGGGLLLLSYIAYVGYLIASTLPAAGV